MDQNSRNYLFSQPKISEKNFIIFRILFAGILIFIFSNFLFHNESLFFHSNLYYVIHTCGLIFSFFFALKLWRRISALLIIAVLAYTLFQHPFVLRVAPGYLGFFLICSIFIDENENRWPTNKSNAKWSIPREILYPLIFVFSFSITYSGITKLLNEHWLSGNALYLLRDNPRLYLPNFIYENEKILKILNWLTIAIELLYLPLIFLKVTKNIATILSLVLFGSLYFYTNIPIVITTIIVVLLFCHFSLDKN